MPSALMATVAGKFTPGQTPPQKGFTFDGSQFRLLFLARGNPIYVTGLNNRGQLSGYFDSGEGNNKGFIIDSATLPIAHMETTAGQLTAAAIEHHEGAASSSGPGNSADRAYRLLQQGGSPGAAATLRALQALVAAGHLGDRRRVQILDDAGDNYAYIAAESMRQRTLQGLLNWLVSQLGAAQQSPQGRQLLVDTVAILMGQAGLDELKAAGELAPFGPVAHLNTPENRQQAAARAQFRDTLRQVITDSVAAKPVEIPLREPDLWLAPDMTAQQRELLDQTLRMVQAQVGTAAADIFLAWAEQRGSDAGTLFGWQVVEQLVGLNTRGQHALAEQALHTLSGVTDPAKTPGLRAFRASGADRDDNVMIVRNGLNPRAELADAASGMGGQLLRAIYSQPKPVAAAAQAPPPVAARASEPARRQGIINPIASPAAALFAGSNAVLKDGVVSFTLKAPKDPRNGQTLTFKGLVPVPESGGKVFIAQDQDGYIVFSSMVPGVIMGQVLAGQTGAATFQKALSASSPP